MLKLFPTDDGGPALACTITVESFASCVMLPPLHDASTVTNHRCLDVLVAVMHEHRPPPQDATTHRLVLVGPSMNHCGL
eukprot:SAG31_NODE_1260_length_9073_cov_2.761088_10_plen_79_part_00